MASGSGEILKGLRFTKKYRYFTRDIPVQDLHVLELDPLLSSLREVPYILLFTLKSRIKKLNIKIVYILCFFNCPTSFRVPFIFFLKIFCTLKKQVIFFLQHAESLVSSVLTSLHETVEGKGIQNLSINKIVVVKIKWHVLHSIAYFKILTTCLILLLN